MKMKLIASFPGKRFDSERRLSEDGRGGWTLSQINVDRWINDYEDYYLIFCFAVLVDDALDDDHVQCTRVTAKMGDDVIGVDEYKWRPNNKMWTAINGQVIFEWPQCIEMSPAQDGIIQLSIQVKLASCSDWIPVAGNGYARIRNYGFSQSVDRRWIKPWRYTILKLMPKWIRRRYLGNRFAAE